MKRKKVLGITAAIVTTGTVIALGSIGNYFYNLALNPTTSKAKVFGTPSKESDDEKEKQKKYGKYIYWLLNDSKCKNIFINSFDKLKLHGYLIKNNFHSNKWVILVHGYTCKGLSMSYYAKVYNDYGYNIIVPDLRGHGDSEGNYIGMGWHDRLDILSWINYIIKDNPNSEIILHGVSMGAATVTMASGEKLPTNIKAIVADCGYTSVLDQFGCKLKDLFSLPKFPILNLSSLVSRIRAGYSLRQASSIKQVKKSKTPILFIHGDKDDFVPYHMMEELFNAAKCEKEMLTIKDAAHANCAIVDPKTYWHTVFNFTDKYLKV